jgi:hypothetical protein
VRCDNEGEIVWSAICEDDYANCGERILPAFGLPGYLNADLTIAAPTPEDSATMPRLAPPTLAGGGPLQKFQKMPAFGHPDPALTLSPE